MNDQNKIESNPLKMTVIIPVFNRKPVTLWCLEQLNIQHRKNLEIVVVDDGSTDGTAAAIRKDFPTVHIVKGSGNWWYSKSVNEGLKYALENINSDCYLLLNNDINFEDSYIDAVLKMLHKYNDEAIIFGSISFNAENAFQPVFLGIKKFIPWLNKQYCYSHEEYSAALKAGVETWDSSFLPGRGMFFSKDTLLKNGLLDESFPQYTSDYEFSARGRKSGIKTRLCLEAVLYSQEKMTGPGSPKNKPTFKKFLLSLFNKYSPTYPINNYKLIKKYTDMPLLMPISFLVILSGKFKAYFKYK
jgi:GT2 family glycosyltransferase